MKASDLMTLGTASVRLDTPLAEVLRVMIDHRIHSVPVITREGRLLGMVSEADFFSGNEPLVTSLLGLGPEERGQRLQALKAGDAMRRDPPCVDAGLPLDQAVRILIDRREARAPVLADGKLTGMLSRSDFLELLAGRRDET